MSNYFAYNLKKIRKENNLSQEQLADELGVSRQAVSKWESGRGYPSIDSLKEIANYFSVTIDELLSGEKIISIAEKENKSNIQRICDLLFGIVDVFSFMLIILPLYPNPINGYIYSVNLFSYTETSAFNLFVYWIMFTALIISGAIKVILTQTRFEKGQKLLTVISMGLSILTVLFLAMTRDAYAITVTFLLLIIKAILLLKHIKASN